MYTFIVIKYFLWKDYQVYILYYYYHGCLFSSLCFLNHVLSTYSQLFSSFEFVRAVGVNIMPIRLQTGQKITAKVIKHISGTAPIYIRALQELEEPETFTSDDQQPCGSVANSIQDYFNRDH